MIDNRSTIRRYTPCAV